MCNMYYVNDIHFQGVILTCLTYVDMGGKVTRLQKMILPISPSILSPLIVFLPIFILKNIQSTEN